MTFRAALLPSALLALACGGFPVADDAGRTLPPPEAPPPPPPPAVIEAPKGEIVLRDDDIVAHGRDDAAAVVLLFSDWKCPHCAKAWPKVLDAVRAHPDAQLRFRTYPLAGPCNPAIAREDPARCTLARAALCAHRAGRFEAYAAEAFDRGEAIVEDPAWREAMNGCVNDPAIAETVRVHAASGTALELVGTPTVFVRIDGEWRAPSGVDAGLALLGG